MTSQYSNNSAHPGYMQASAADHAYAERPYRPGHHVLVPPVVERDDTLQPYENEAPLAGDVLPLHPPPAAVAPHSAGSTEWLPVSYTNGLESVRPSSSQSFSSTTGRESIQRSAGRLPSMPRSDADNSLPPLQFAHMKSTASSSAGTTSLGTNHPQELDERTFRSRRALQALERVNQNITPALAEEMESSIDTLKDTSAPLADIIEAEQKILGLVNRVEERVTEIRHAHALPPAVAAGYPVGHGGQYESGNAYIMAAGGSAYQNDMLAYRQPSHMFFRPSSGTRGLSHARNDQFHGLYGNPQLQGGLQYAFGGPSPIFDRTHGSYDFNGPAYSGEQSWQPALRGSLRLHRSEDVSGSFDRLPPEMDEHKPSHSALDRQHSESGHPDGPQNGQSTVRMERQRDRRNEQAEREKIKITKMISEREQAVDRDGESEHRSHTPVPQTIYPVDAPTTELDMTGAVDAPSPNSELPAGRGWKLIDRKLVDEARSVYDRFSNALAPLAEKMGVRLPALINNLQGSNGAHDRGWGLFRQFYSLDVADWEPRRDLDDAFAGKTCAEAHTYCKEVLGADELGELMQLFAVTFPAGSDVGDLNTKEKFEEYRSVLEDLVGWNATSQDVEAHVILARCSIKKNDPELTAAICSQRAMGFHRRARLDCDDDLLWHFQVHVLNRLSQDTLSDLWHDAPQLSVSDLRVGAPVSYPNLDRAPRVADEPTMRRFIYLTLKAICNAVHPLLLSNYDENVMPWKRLYKNLGRNGLVLDGWDPEVPLPLSHGSRPDRGIGGLNKKELTRLYERCRRRPCPLRIKFAEPNDHETREKYSVPIDPNDPTKGHIPAHAPAILTDPIDVGDPSNRWHGKRFALYSNGNATNIAVHELRSIGEKAAEQANNQSDRSIKRRRRKKGLSRSYWRVDEETEIIAIDGIDPVSSDGVKAVGQSPVPERELAAKKQARVKDKKSNAAAGRENGTGYQGAENTVQLNKAPRSEAPSGTVAKLAVKDVDVDEPAAEEDTDSSGTDNHSTISSDDEGARRMVDPGSDSSSNASDDASEDEHESLSNHTREDDVLERNAVKENTCNTPRTSARRAAIASRSELERLQEEWKTKKARAQVLLENIRYRKKHKGHVQFPRLKSLETLGVLEPEYRAVQQRLQELDELIAAARSGQEAGGSLKRSHGDGPGSDSKPTPAKRVRFTTLAGADAELVERKVPFISGHLLLPAGLSEAELQSMGAVSLRTNNAVPWPIPPDDVANVRALNKKWPEGVPVSASVQALITAALKKNRR